MACHPQTSRLALPFSCDFGAAHLVRCLLCFETMQRLATATLVTMALLVGCGEAPIQLVEEVGGRQAAIVELVKEAERQWTVTATGVKS